MGLDLNNVRELGGPGNSQSGGQTYSVFSTTDNQATMLADGYLDALSFKLFARDLVFLSAVDGGQMVQISSVTEGDVKFRNVLTNDSFDTIIEAGAVSLKTAITYISTTGVIGITIADGTLGQRKTLIMVVDGGTATLTPVNFANGTSIAFADVNDAFEMIFSPTIGWAQISTSGAVVT